MRPPLPITLPRSASATCSSSSTSPLSRSERSTRTSSGESTSWRARYSSSSSIGAELDAGDLEQLLDGRRGLRALRDPVACAIGVDLDQRRLELRVVAADLLQGAAVTWGARIGHDDPVDRVLVRAVPREADLHHWGTTSDVTIRTTTQSTRAGVSGAACPGTGAPCL